jgi:hypothetical protein
VLEAVAVVEHVGCAVRFDEPCPFGNVLYIGVMVGTGPPYGMFPSDAVMMSGYGVTVTAPLV